MKEESNRITIGFHYVDTFGNTYDSSSTVEMLYDMGDNELSTIGRQLNAFLRQCGYYRRREMILMDDITEEEYDSLLIALDEMRSSEENKDAD